MGKGSQEKESCSAGGGKGAEGGGRSTGKKEFSSWPRAQCGAGRSRQEPSTCSGERLGRTQGTTEREWVGFCWATISSRGCGDGKRGGWQGRWNPEHLLFSALIVGSALKQQGSLGFEAGE